MGRENVQLDTRGFDNASNVLVLAPLTPTGNRACMELIASTAPPEGSNVAAITYTQPPETWLTDWREQFGDLPAEIAFIHANSVESSGEAADDVPSDVSVAKVDPGQPMDIIAPLTERLTQWEETDDQSIVSVQTLTILLEYVDFDTAFRYLHILTHRVREADSVGYYQMDPEIHDEETVNTLKTLFDAVIEVSSDGEEWSVTETYRSDQSVPTDEHAQSHDTDVSPPGETESALGSVRTFLSRLVSGPEQPSANGETPAPTDVRADQQPAATGDEPSTAGDAVADPDGHSDDLDDIPEDVMMTDEDRVRELLRNYGGRMKQADVTEETDWSKSTVSRKLSSMEEEGLITRVQVGRGNLVFLSGYEPETAKAPFEKKTD